MTDPKEFDGRNDFAPDTEGGGIAEDRLCSTVERVEHIEEEETAVCMGRLKWVKKF
ncbi:hypothetical protein [Acetobacter orientalis]|uniref:hypothetical protein n=1 Tax=Acetobacter orientalis TaxID=146474 RepID=UPI0039EAC968